MICYTDGACSGNPGKGGFGVVVLDDNENLITAYAEPKEHTTNNEMEMRAILWATAYALLKEESYVTIYSDSSYAVNTFSKWMYGWQRNGWTKGDGYPPKNLDIVKAFYELSQKIQVNFKLIRGHQGNEWNEVADKLAVSAKEP